MDTASGFDSARKFFAGDLTQYDFKVKVLWWIGLTVIGAWILAKSRFGNWIYSAGGEPQCGAEHRRPVVRTKIALFMMTSTTAALMGIIEVFELRSMQAKEGVGLEFIFIICAVVGGCLLTGGYSSVIGTFFGAAMLGMVQLGIIDAQWDSNWTYAFQGRDPVQRRRAEHPAPQPRAESQMTMSRPSGNGKAHLLEVEAISKYYGNIVALKDISTFVNAGEVTCILGDNGAGKSSFIKILSGAPPGRRGPGPHRGPGDAVRIAARRARAQGIATVYQDLAMVPLMSIWRNFFLGAEPRKGVGPLRWFDSGTAKRVVRKELSEMGIDAATPTSRSASPAASASPSRNRARRPLRRARADPRRANVRPRREAGRGSAQVHRSGTRPRRRRHLHPRLAYRYRSATAS